MAKHCQNWHESHVETIIPFSVWGAQPPRPPVLVIVNHPFHFSGSATAMRSIVYRIGIITKTTCSMC